MGCGLSKAHSNPEVLVSHANAVTTFHGRLLIVQRSRAGWPQAHIAAAMGISRRCVSKWVTRFNTEGEAGLHDRSSRPRSTPTRLDAAAEAAVVELRRTQRLGRDEIAHRLGLAPRTVSRVRRRGCSDRGSAQHSSWAWATPDAGLPRQQTGPGPRVRRHAQEPMNPTSPVRMCDMTVQGTCMSPAPRSTVCVACGARRVVQGG